MKDPIRTAKRKGIIVEYCNLPKTFSISTPEIGKGAILLDYSLLYSRTKERVHAAHELGHVVLGAYYNAYSKIDIRAKHELKANRWAAHHLIPPEKIKKAMRSGYTEAWQLAEYFDVTEEFIRTAIYIYQCEELIS